MSLESSSSPQPDLLRASKEFKPSQFNPADAVAKASVTTQVLSDRSVTLRLMAPGARQVSALVGFSNPPTVTAPRYPLKMDGQGLWSTTIKKPGLEDLTLFLPSNGPEPDTLRLMNFE